MSQKITQSKTSHIPKLRFPGFAGVWEEKRLEKTGNFLKGRNISKEAVIIDGKNKCIRYGELYTEYNEIIREIKSRTNTSKELSMISKNGDVLFPSSGETALDIATFSCVKNDGVLLGGDLNVLRPNISHCGEFLAYYISNFKKRNIAKLSQGYSVVHLYASDVKKLEVTIPSLLEQQKISTFLGAVDTWIENLRMQKEAFEAYKKGMMHKLFSQEIRFKDDNGKDFPEWEEKRLGELADIIGGGTPDTTNLEYWNGKINWFTPTEIKQNYVSSSIRKISDSGLKNSSAQLLPVGTVLFTSRATVGDVSISTEISTTNQGFQSFVANKDNSNIFIYYWIKMNTNEFIRRSNGSTFLEISGREIRKIKGIFPRLIEQQKIATFLTYIDKVIESKQQQIIQAEQWKNGLMQGLFV